MSFGGKAGSMPQNMPINLAFMGSNQRLAGIMAMSAGGKQEKPKQLNESQREDTSDVGFLKEGVPGGTGQNFTAKIDSFKDLIA